uniref:DUF229 domain containing protein n=1 Tax=Plectus sambesii TaxID=2011161 RepID=A0A914W1I4_9BILA
MLRRLRQQVIRPRALLAPMVAMVFVVVWVMKAEEKATFEMEPERDLLPLPAIVVVRKNPGDSSGPSQTSGKIQMSKAGEQTCRIPKLDVNDPVVIKFFSKPPPLTCYRAEKNWAFVEDGRFYISDAAIRVHGPIKCDLLRFWRVSDAQLETDIVRNVKNGSMIEKSDYFRAGCAAKDGAEWGNLFATIVPVPAAIDRARAAEKIAAATGLNVYFLGFDSLSSLTFQRKLKRAYNFLTKELEAVVLQGYNIVGDGTPQAFIPILTAQTEVELPMTRKRFADANYVDVYPMIWRNYSQRGHATLYAEDSAAVGTFTYRLKGFKKQPTDHYMRTFFMKTEKELVDRKCIGSEPQHVAWFRYGEDFFDRYPSEVNKFALMHHSQLSHDDLNTVALADKDFTAHLRRMRDKGHLNNTLLIVMADHGHRFAKLRETHQGQVEERLPFFSIALPAAFREGRGKLAWANLKANAQRLTTPFDIHATLMDILSWPTDEQLAVTGKVEQRSLSLWRPIPLERTCEEAGIEAHWCTCLNWETAEGPEVNMVARAVVQVMNDETEPERKLCARLRLSKIEEAKRLVSNDEMLRYKNVKDADGFVPDLGGNTQLAFATYQLRIRTEPGDALYEVTLRYDIKEMRVTVDLGAISHINAYGDRPHCIIDKNYFLAAYCICYDKI